jgi:uncharacterized protein YciI
VEAFQTVASRLLNIFINFKTHHFTMPQFLILADDYKDPDALTRRLSVRKEHLNRVRREKVEGRFIVGGAKLNDQGNMHGSMLVVQLEDEEAVRNWVNQDPYIIGKVWERVEILPFRVAEV